MSEERKISEATGVEYAPDWNDPVGRAAYEAGAQDMMNRVAQEFGLPTSPDTEYVGKEGRELLLNGIRRAARRELA